MAQVTEQRHFARNLSAQLGAAEERVDVDKKYLYNIHPAPTRPAAAADSSVTGR